jgi:ADP-ribose pyrophosphatase YjhB (NUDIX family)
VTVATQAVRLVAVVVDGDHVLLIKHRDRGWWELPAGELQIDEDILTGLRRIVGHATGLVVAVDRLSGVYTDGETGLSLVFPGGWSACRALMLGASGYVVCDSACRGVVHVVHVVHWAGGHRRGWQASGVSGADAVGGWRYWTLLNDDLEPVVAADEFLRHLRFGRDAAECTTRTYAGGIALLLQWCALNGSGLAWLRYASPKYGKQPDRPAREVRLSPRAIWHFAAFAPLRVTPSKANNPRTPRKPATPARMVHAAARAAMTALSR